MQPYCIQKLDSADSTANRKVIRSKIIQTYFTTADKAVLQTEMSTGHYLASVQHYWSASYTDTTVVGTVATVPVGIDIEKVVPRNDALLKSLPGNNNDWERFYIIWTAKEAVIKAYSLTLHAHEQISYVSHTDTTTTVEFAGESILCDRFQYQKYIISICRRNTNG